jgi:hypothetical protein
MLRSNLPNEPRLCIAEASGQLPLDQSASIPLYKLYKPFIKSMNAEFLRGRWEMEGQTVFRIQVSIVAIRVKI